MAAGVGPRGLEFETYILEGAVCVWISKQKSQTKYIFIFTTLTRWEDFLWFSHHNVTFDYFCVPFQLSVNNIFRIKHLLAFKSTIVIIVLGAF